MGRIRRSPSHPEPRLRRTITRVLLVDDDDLAVDRYERVLSEAGAEVTSVASVPAALRELEAGSFDLVLVDYLLHGFHGPNGLDVVAATRAEAATYVLALHPQTVPHEAARAAGADAILDKAFLDPDGLRQLLLDVQLGKAVAGIPACWSTRTARYEA